MGHFNKYDSKTISKQKGYKLFTLKSNNYRYGA